MSNPPPPGPPPPPGWGTPPPPEGDPPPGGWGAPPPAPPGGGYGQPYGQPAYGQPPGQPFQQYGYGYGQGAGTAEYAGFWIRFLALIIDGAIIGIPIALVGAMFGSAAFTGGVGFNPGASLAINLLSIVVGAAYYGILEGGPSGQTLGKKAVSIRVVDATTGQAGIGTARGVGRYFARWLSQIVLYLGYFWMLWDPKKQCWHDKLARTIVVKAR